MSTTKEYNQYKLLCDQLRTIGHPERLRILLVLNEQSRTMQELQNLTELPANTLLNHLHKMRLLRIIEQTRFHRVVQYSLADGHVGSILHTAQQHLHAPQ